MSRNVQIVKNVHLYHATARAPGTGDGGCLRGTRAARWRQRAPLRELRDQVVEAPHGLVDMPHRQVLRQIELVAKEVLPAFR
jgi:hypothetical protein